MPNQKPMMTTHVIFQQDAALHTLSKDLSTFSRVISTSFGRMDRSHSIHVLQLKTYQFLFVEIWEAKGVFWTISQHSTLKQQISERAESFTPDVLCHVWQKINYWFLINYWYVEPLMEPTVNFTKPTEKNLELFFNFIYILCI